VLDDLPLSPPRLVVSESDLSRGEIAAVYAVALGVTVIPLALTLLSLPTRG
jgi:hypothetical protein